MYGRRDQRCLGERTISFGMMLLLLLKQQSEHWSTTVLCEQHMKENLQYVAFILSYSPLLIHGLQLDCLVHL
jgi:hypothetical protein